MRLTALGLAFVIWVANGAGDATFRGLGTRHPSPFGGVFPLGGASIRLVSEEVLIRPEADGIHYRVEARYQLTAGKPADVPFGVPLNGTGDATLARTVRLELAGKQTGCEARPASDPGGPAGWCAGTLAVPAGDGLLVLRYRGELDDEHWELPIVPHIGHGRFVYPLSPAGHWANPPAQVRVKVDLSLLPGAEVQATPAPASATPPVLAWSFDGAAAASARQLAVELILKWAFPDHDFLAVAGGKMDARTEASSVLEPAADNAAARVADADVLTAWCAGASKTGGSQWVEMRMSTWHGEDMDCTMPYIGILPGKATLVGQPSRGRPARIRLSECGGGRPFEDRKVSAPSPNASTAMETIVLPIDLQKTSDLCVRITVFPAHDAQACISEIIPHFDCNTAMMLR